MHLPLSFVLASLLLAAPAVSADRLNKRVCSRRPTGTPLLTAITTASTAPATAPAAGAHTNVASAPASSSAAAAAASPSSGATKPANLAQASSADANAITALKYTDVGGAGYYNMVTALAPGAWPSCTVSPSCTTTRRAVSGALAPFNEGITVAFRGPLNVDNIAVYQPGADGSSWGLTSSFAAGQTPKNLVWMNNKGGGESGEWSVCQGASQSYASGDFTSSVKSANAEIFSGKIPGNQEANIVTAEACTSANCLGFTRGTSNAGWRASKMFVIKVEMPSTSGTNTPAIWALNDQVVHAAQYGCNCRGEGLDQSGPLGGCGELDILEVLQGKDAARAFSEVYSVNGATGSGAKFFERPTSGANVYAVIFDEQTDAITIQQWTDFDFSTASLSRSAIDGYLSAAATTVKFGGSKKRRDHRRGLHHGHAQDGAF